MTPRRIQRKRTKDWRMPAGADGAMLAVERQAKKFKWCEPNNPKGKK
jgi:hypothetical protein